jgi:hypothetical protein
MAHHSNQESRQQSKTQDDLHHTTELPLFKPGDTVYVWKTPKTVPNPKLAAEWEEGVIMAQTGPATYRVHRPNRVRKKDITLNAQHIKIRITADNESNVNVIVTDMDLDLLEKALDDGYTLRIGGRRRGGGAPAAAAPDAAAEQELPAPPLHRAPRPQRSYQERELARLASHLTDPPPKSRAPLKRMGSFIAQNSRSAVSKAAHKANKAASKTRNLLSPSRTDIATPGTSGTSRQTKVAPLPSRPAAQTQDPAAQGGWGDSPDSTPPARNESQAPIRQPSYFSFENLWS